MKYLDKFILDRIDSKKKRLESMLLDQNSLKQIQWNILIEYVYNSNAIDGSNLSQDQTRIIIETGRDIMAKLPYFQHLCINHTNAFEYIRKNMKQEIAVDHILRLHDLTMSYLDKEAGQFRDHGSVNKIRQKLESMIKKLAASNEYHPIEKAVLLQAIIHQVRPFNYGVGAIARLLTKWMLNQNGYMYGLPLNPFEVKYYRKCIEQSGKGVIYPLVKINVMCIEDTTAQLIRQVKSLNIIPIEEAMSRNNLDSSQMLESIKRGEYRAFKKDGRLYVTDAREKGMSFGVELIDLFE